MATVDEQVDAAKKSAPRALSWLGLLAVVVAILVCASVVLTVRRRQGSALLQTLALVPNGVAVADADRLMGGPPDSVHQTPGVLVNGATLLGAENADALKHGPIANYEIRRWDRGDLHAFVIVGDDGKVAGRTSMRDSLARRWLPSSWIDLLP
jgi:hypothetical protein